MSGRDPAPGVGPALVRELLAAARSRVDAAGERDSRLPGATITAVGWGTVELDRAERELGVALRLGADLGL